jgi:hypothetical protein
MSRPRSSSTSVAIPLSRIVAWSVDAFRLWWTAPFRLWLLSLLPLVGEGLLQMFVPDAGMILSKLVSGLLTGGLLWALHRAANEGRAPLSSVIDVFRGQRGWGVLAMAAMTLVVFAIQVAVAASAYGPAVFDAYVLGHVRAHPSLLTHVFNLVLILPGVLPMVWLLLAWCLMLFAGQSMGASLLTAARAMVRHALPLGGWVLLNVALFTLMLGTRFGMVLILVLAIWSAAGTYLAYCDIAGMPWRQRTPQPADAR